MPRRLRGTNIQAASIDIQATQGDLSATAAKLQATDISLEAKQNILLTAGANQSDIKSSNKSSSVGGGVTLGMGEQTGISFQLSASQAKGRVNGSETLYDNSQVIASDSLSLKSGSDTTLQGAQLGGDKVTMNVGGNLTIQTQQDQSLYDSKQSSAGFSLSVCVPPICAGTFVTGSLNIAKQTISQNYLSAVGQSGITAGSQGFDIQVQGNTDLQGAGITSKAAADKNRLQTGSLTSSDLANHQNTSSSSMSVGLAYTGASTGATLAANAASNVLGNALGGAGLPSDKNEQSQTLSVVSPAVISITGGDAASQETAAKLTSRDASTANQSLTNTFSLQQAQAVEAEAKEQQARQQAAQLVGAVVTNVIGDVAAAKYKESGGTAWGEGSPEKIALHGMAGLIQAKIGGTDAAAGIAAGMAHEAMAPVMTKYLNDLGYDTSTKEKAKDFNELMEAGSKLLGAAVGAAVGDSAKNAAAGSQIALVADQNNRQLHPDEERWIRANAKKFAEEQGISVEQATALLSQQAVKDSDLVHRALQSDGDNAAAKKFLLGSGQTFTNELGQQQQLFTSTADQLIRMEQYGDMANPDFYKQYVKPGQNRELVPGLRKEMADLSTSAAKGVADMAKSVWDNRDEVPGALLDGAKQAPGALWEGVKRAPGAVRDAFVSGGTALGEGAAVAFDQELTDKLNSLYGRDVSGAQQTLLAARTLLTLTGAAGVAKQAGEAAAAAAVGEAAVKQVAKRAAKKADEAAEREAIAKAKIDNNASADMPGFGSSAVRDFSPGTTHRAENINAGQVTDRDGLQRVDADEKTNNAQIKEMAGQNPTYWGTQRQAWKEGTVVTDRVTTQPEVYRMVIDKRAYEDIQNALRDGKPDVAAGSLGGWATKDPIANANDVRNNLAISSEWKGQGGAQMYVVEFTVKPGVGLREGTVGSMYDADIGVHLPGGGHQVQFMQNAPRSVPGNFEINPNSLRKLGP